MPIYDFECNDCNVVQEVFVRKEGEQICPLCKKPMVRLVGAPSFQLRGTGWYKTDFAGKSDTPKKVSE